MQRPLSDAAEAQEGDLVSEVLDDDYDDYDDDCSNTAYGYCCSICNAQAAHAHDEERLMAIPSLAYFTVLVETYRKPSDARRLLRERERRIASGEHPGNRILVCPRCGNEWDSWDRIPHRFCRPCNDERWELDEDGVKTRAYRGKLPESVAREVERAREQKAQREREERDS
jgi:hypothetical protein